MNEAEQREQQARGDAIDALIRALFVVRSQCSDLGQFKVVVARIAPCVHQAYEDGVRDPEDIIRGMAVEERLEAAEEV